MRRRLESCCTATQHHIPAFSLNLKMADQLSRTYQRKLRDQASVSLDELRQKLEISPKKTPNRRKSKPDAKSSPYSASVERLKELIKRHEKSSSHRTSATNDLSLQLDIPPPDELAPLLNDQHTLLQHLEGQVSYYKDALDMLKQKAEIVIDENNRLHEQLVSGIQNEIVELDRSQIMAEEPRMSLNDCATQTEHHDMPESRDTPNIDLDANKAADEDEIMLQGLKAKSPIASKPDETESRPPILRPFDDELAKLKDVHSIKTKQLESMLKSTREELEDNKNYIKTLEAKTSETAGIPVLKQEPDGQGLCIKCAHSKAVLNGFNGFNDKVVKRMERENNELLETVQKQRVMVDDMKKKEMEAFLQVKRTCELAEEIQLQKQEMIMKYQQAMKEIERIKVEHSRQVAKINELGQKEKIKIQNEHEENSRQLTSLLNEASEKLARTEIQLERVTREKLDLKTSLTQLEDYTENHDKEMIMKLDDVRHSLAHVTEETTALKQHCQRLESEKKNLELILEKRNTVSNGELYSVRKRLAEVTEKLEISNQECMQLTEELHKCQKQLQGEKASRNLEAVNYKNQIEQLKSSKKEREDKLLHSLREAEESHVRTKTELGSMLESQIEIGNSLKEEYRKLMKKHEELEARSRLDQLKISEENRALLDELSMLKEKHLECTVQESKLRGQLTTCEQSLADAETQAKAYYEKAFKLLTRYNSVLKERQHLHQEVDFLRSQLTDFQPNEKFSISDLDNVN